MKGCIINVQIFIEIWIANKKPSILGSFIGSTSKLNSENESQANVLTCYGNND